MKRQKRGEAKDIIKGKTVQTRKWPRRQPGIPETIKEPTIQWYHEECASMRHWEPTATFNVFPHYAFERTMTAIAIAYAEEGFVLAADGRNKARR